MTDALAVDLWTWDLDAPVAAAAVATLSDDERARAARFVHDRDRRRYVAGRARLRAILADYMGRPAEVLRFRYGAHGKPALDDAGDLCFNLSHTGDLAALAVTRGHELGVDIERAEPVREDVASRFFSVREQAALRQAPADDQVRGFHRIWTRKEAFVKALGEGLSTPLAAFAVTLDDDAPALAWREGVPDAPDFWAFAHFEPRPDVIGAIAVRVHGRAVRICARSV